MRFKRFDKLSRVICPRSQVPSHGSQEKENELNEHRQALTTFSRFHANGTAFNETYAQNKWAKLSCIKPGSKKPLGYRYIKYTKRREQTFSIKLV